MSGHADLISEDQEVLRHLLSRRGVSVGYFFFISRLIVSIPKGEVRDYQVMRQLRKPLALALPFPRTLEDIADELRWAAQPTPWGALGPDPLGLGIKEDLDTIY